jgi:hypothetical protein
MPPEQADFRAKIGECAPFHKGYAARVFETISHT